MKKNMLWWDRGLRFVCGVLAVAWGVASGPVALTLGLYLLATGAWGYCPVYALLNYQPRT